VYSILVEDSVVKERIPSDSAKWLARQVLFMGIPLDSILKGTGLEETWMNEDGALITHAQYLRIVDNALDVTRDPALGLNIGPKQYLGDLGFMGYAMISGPTLRDANQAALKFWELNGSLVTLSYHEDTRYSTWEIYPAFPMSSQRIWIYAVEELISTFYKAACFLSNQALLFTEIHLSYPEPEHGALYRELFRCPVFFGRPINLLRVAVTYLDQPTFTGHPQMALVCQQQCQDLLKKLRRNDDLLDAIREIIVSSMSQVPHLQEVAARLAMSPRTLRRRLRERNSTYQHILDEVRVELAKEYVGATNLSVDQIACRIGFTEATTFRRAFKKWTGMNIKEFRKTGNITDSS
jgi:AraC-like DNA-binding protein